MLSYALSASSAGAPFTVDEKTGEIKTLQRLDYEENKLYELEIKARQKDNKHEGIGKVIISIYDKNDMEPQPQGPLTITYCVDTDKSSM